MAETKLLAKVSDANVVLVVLCDERPSSAARQRRWGRSKKLDEQIPATLDLQKEASREADC